MDIFLESPATFALIGINILVSIYAISNPRFMERYTFLIWGQAAFDNFRVVPPGTGICHQLNLEYLSRSVWSGRSCNRKNILERLAAGSFMSMVRTCS